MIFPESAIDASARNGQVIDVELLKYLSPLGYMLGPRAGDELAIANPS